MMSRVKVYGGNDVQWRFTVVILYSVEVYGDNEAQCSQSGDALISHVVNVLI